MQELIDFREIESIYAITMQNKKYILLTLNSYSYKINKSFPVHFDETLFLFLGAFCNTF